MHIDPPPPTSSLEATPAARTLQPQSDNSSARLTRTSFNFLPFLREHTPFRFILPDLQSPSLDSPTGKAHIGMIAEHLCGSPSSIPRLPYQLGRLLVELSNIKEVFMPGSTSQETARSHSLSGSTSTILSEAFPLPPGLSWLAHSCLLADLERT